MKKILLLLFAFTLSLASCKKDDKDDSNTEPAPQTYEQRIEGEWDLVAVSYDTEIPDLTGGGSPTPIAGNGKDVSGDFNLTRDPNRVVYDLNFKAELDPFGTGSGFEIPVNFESSGDWTTTSDASKLIVTDDMGEEIIFDVEVNEQNKQVFSSAITESVDLLGFPLSLEVDLLLTFERDN